MEQKDQSKSEVVCNLKATIWKSCQAIFYLFCLGVYQSKNSMLKHRSGVTLTMLQQES